MSLPKPYYQDSAVTIYHGDCREIVPQLGRFDLLLTDPPYGINYVAADSPQRGAQKHAAIIGDMDQFNLLPWMGFLDVLVWGANNYCDTVPPRLGQWYFWDKTLENNRCRISEGEFAWHKRGTKPRAFRHLWSGAYRASEHSHPSQHPTQKPVALMSWCIQRSDTSGPILDPFMGSGTTLRAAKDLGRKAVGIEIEERYCEIAAKRMGQEILPLTAA